MRFDFSSVSKPIMTSSVSLRTVYVLFADQTYDVLKESAGLEDWVALRTMEGTGCLKLEGLPDITVTADTLMVFKHRDVRRYYCSGDSWHFFWFEFTVSDILRIPPNTVQQIDALESEQAECHACMELLRANDEGSSRLASATLSFLLCKWERSLEKGGKESHRHNAVQQVVNYMNANLEKHITVRSMAEKAGFSERRFRQVFELAKGMPPKQYLESLRMKMAEALLLNTSLPILSIADRLGYCSQFHFSKRFSAVYLISPSQYRKSPNGKKP